jgi:hypothetical protein
MKPSLPAALAALAWGLAEAALAFPDSRLLPEPASVGLSRSQGAAGTADAGSGSSAARVALAAPPSRSDALTDPAPPRGAPPEDGAIADSGEDADSIVAEADSAARAVLAESAAGDGVAAAPALWLETYGEGVSSTHEDDNLAGFADWKVGKRLPGPLRADVYAKIRLYRDQRDFFWNNRADAGLGMRMPLLRALSLTLFAEGTWGHYLNLASGALPMDRLQARIDNNRTAIDLAQKQFQAIYQTVFQANLMEDTAIDRASLKKLDTLGNAQLKTLQGLNAKLDSLQTSKDSLRQAMDSIALVPAGEVTEFKIGLVFWHGWGGPDEGRPIAWFAFPFRPWGDIYADCIGSSLERHVKSRQLNGEYADSAVHIRNVILYANPSVGWMMMDGRIGSLAAYATAYAWYDIHRDWWNNLAMGGPGVRYQPFRGIDLSIKAEYLWGRYYGRERKEDPNPYARVVSDTRVTASFWHGLGM